VPGKDWVAKRMKAPRFHLNGLPGRVVRHARPPIIRLGADTATLGLILAARQSIRALASLPGLIHACRTTHARHPRVPGTRAKARGN